MDSYAVLEALKDVLPPPSLDAFPLTDRGIEEAIRSNWIELHRPEEYLEDLKNMIQPASMDIVMHGQGEFSTEYALPLGHTLLSKRGESPGENFVTFQPGEDTVVVNTNVEWTKEPLIPIFEIRSTLRRLGLEVGPIGPMYSPGEGCELQIRNLRRYPISIEVGTKVGQFLIYEYDPNAWEGERLSVPFDKGRMVASRRDLEGILSRGELRITPSPMITDYGIVLFHAGDTQTRYEQVHHLVLQEDKKTYDWHDGKMVPLQSRDRTMQRHRVLPGDFVSVRTQEDVQFSNTVGMRVYPYLPRFGEWGRRKPHSDAVFKMRHSGGWIDPGYGKDKPASFFVQAQNGSDKPQVIMPGDVVAVGVVHYYPQGVGNAYGAHRGSNYAGQTGRFLATQKMAEVKG
jgi:deoxycytidine triphosphate deaminase